MKLHTIEWIDTPKGACSLQRIAVHGGWLYQMCEQGTDLAPVFVADPTALHCRPKVRRFKMSDAVAFDLFGNGNRDGKRIVYAPRHDISRTMRVWHKDGSFSDHLELADAHDALLASGSDSPWVEVTE